MKPIEYHAQNGKPKRGYIYNHARLGFSTMTGKNFYGDRELLEEIYNHTCQVCGHSYDPDIRWLRLACFYDLSEVSDKLKYDEKQRLYLMPFCKDCRGEFMGILGDWLNRPERMSA